MLLFVSPVKADSRMLVPMLFWAWMPSDEGRTRLIWSMSPSRRRALHAPLRLSSAAKVTDAKKKRARRISGRFIRSIVYELFRRRSEEHTSELQSRGLISYA